jgi:histidine ammonia-lyase
MGTIAARQAKDIVDNVERILALELFAACQAIDFRREVLGSEAQLGRGTAPAYRLIRGSVPFLEKDDVMYPYIESVRELIANGSLRQAVREAVPEEIG